MRHFGWIVAAPVAALLLAACGDEEAPISASPSDAPSSADPGQVYTGFFTVLESAEHGPQLCSVVMESYPPQCGGPDVLGWNWDETPDAETVDGVTWGFYSVTGTWDGTALTLTEAPLPGAATSPMVPDDALPDFTSPCEPPAGGWAVVDPATATQAALDAATALAASEPDFAGVWVDQSINPASTEPTPDEGAMNDPTKLVLNARFTGDLERHEADLRAVWGGALCVSAAEHTEQDLLAIQEEVLAELGELASGAGTDPTTGAVTVDVFVDDGLQARLDQQYGAGVVRVTAALQPVE
ncbi:hypothetical protein [Jiangella aurantiaca]|uniref:hypothetical protein n=1 Tax=Jiangella aurantiaca TaxID=2530373 RepID=UPI0013A5BEF0|nr:hypothetical protein [Jiangella aurantiaca]